MPDSDEKLHWAVDAVKNLGVPTAILCVLTYGFWQVAGWTGENVVKPLVSHQMQMMHTLENNSRLHAEALQKIQVSINSQEELLEKMCHEQEK